MAGRSAGRTGTALEPELPREAQPRRLLRRAAQVLALFVLLVAVVLFAPGLGEVRQHLADADTGWLAVGVALEFLSGCSYVLAFRPVFCERMSWRTTWEISWAELGMGSLVPASGAGGLALGAWILSRGGMPADQIARRSVAFFLVKSSVNFVAVAVLGAMLAVGLVGPEMSLWLTAFPAAMAAAVVAGTVALGLPRRARAGAAPRRTRRAPRWWAAVERAIVGGVREALALLRGGDPLLLAGVVGYWAFDNAVLWATYHAVGASLPITVILMGYLIGQLGGLLPIPGGIGGIEGGLIGALVVYGAPASATAAAVLAYRVILFWLPLLIGAVSFRSLLRSLDDPERPDLCTPPTPA